MSQRAQRVAVIGAGIAGMGAAWSLNRAGRRVTVYEAESHVGGNARTYTWSLPEGGQATTGLSVLAWPALYFRNYERLLSELSVETDEVPIRFLVKSRSGVIGHGLDTLARDHFADDFRRWNRLVERVRRFNSRLARERRPSLYAASPLNPLTFLSLRKAARLSGLSKAFWDHVVVPIYSSSFLTVDLKGVPAVILPILDDILSLERGSTLRTWANTSADVFARLMRGFESSVHTDRPIVRVEKRQREWVVLDERGEGEAFDVVVFACPAPAALAAIAEPRRLQRRMLGAVAYTEDRDASYLEGHVHSDAGLLPASHRDALLAGYCNYVEVFEQADGSRRYENTFIISSWAPTARGTTLPMLVTYDPQRPIDGVRLTFSNRRAHPALSTRNLLVVARLRRIQGRDGLYYCGSYTTPGNGHDLSLLSGLAVAEQLGAVYPFADDVEAARDFAFLRRLMFGRRGRRGG